MAAMIRPTLLLRIDLDEGIYNDDVVAEIKRSYSYVAPTLVTSHSSSEEEEAENNICFEVKIRKPYWLSSEEGADELWQEVMLKWLRNMFNKTSVTMTAYNKNRREKDEDELIYGWLELGLGNVIIAIKLGDDSSVPDGSVDRVAQVRQWVNESVLADEEINYIRIPSRASYQNQIEEAHATAVVEEEAVVVEQEDGSTEEATEVTEEVTFDIDYSTWGIEYKDGTVKEFDSREGMFL